jgi:lysophospholipase L1-like esterase
LAPPPAADLHHGSPLARGGHRLGTLALGGVGLLLSLLLLEGFLRVYDPFGQRVWGDRIILPTRYRKVFDNRENPRLDAEVVFSKNSIGFRGPDPPAAFDERLTVVAVGGSTTECLYLTDGKDWPQVLGAMLASSFPGVWVNNAGLDGHSTYGHILLVRQRLARLRPRVVLFLVGINDLGRTQMRPQDRALVDGKGVPWSVRLARHSAIAATALNLRRGWEAQQVNLPYREIDLSATPAFLPGRKRREDLLATHRAHLPAYAERLEELVRLSREAGMEPVFLTQPALYGEAVDDVTGVDLAVVEVDRERLLNGRAAWELLELYNDVTRVVGGQQGVLVVDVARALPKSSRLFYDFVHFTNEGAAAVARVTYVSLCPLLARRFPRHLTQACPGAAS